MGEAGRKNSVDLEVRATAELELGATAEKEPRAKS